MIITHYNLGRKYAGFWASFIFQRIYRNLQFSGNHLHVLYEEREGERESLTISVFKLALMHIKKKPTCCALCACKSQSMIKTENQRTNGPVDAHLLGLVKHKTWNIYGKEMTLTFNTHLPS